MIDTSVMNKLSYGLFVLTARSERDNGCIVNTVAQITQTPLRVTVAVNKANLTHDMILTSGSFNASILTQSAEMPVFTRFGFQSGKTIDKFAGLEYAARSDNGLYYLTKYTNGIISAEVAHSLDCGSHTLFIADVTASFMLSDDPSVTYQYYFDHIKPKTQQKKTGYVCKICGYVYESATLPEDYICPICKHGAVDFERTDRD